MSGRYFVGKRVACLKMEDGDGMWTEYALASAVGGVLPLNASVGLDLGTTHLQIRPASDASVVS